MDGRQGPAIRWSGGKLRALALSAGLAVALSACGTNVKWLVARESDDAWRNDRLIRLAESREAELLPVVLAAEDAKFRSCRAINDAARERLGRLRLPFWEQILADVKLLAALLIPLPMVERCSDGHQTYEEAIIRLQEELAVDPAPVPVKSR